MFCHTLHGRVKEMQECFEVATNISCAMKTIQEKTCNTANARDVLMTPKILSKNKTLCVKGN